MKYQFMPMFWGDFFANTLHLTAQELGAYTALIGHVWEHEGKIAAADVQRVARVANYNWPKVRPRVQQFFDVLSTPNTWCHERVITELARSAEISNKRKDAAEQMHSKSRARRDANGTHTTLQDIESSNGKGRDAKPVQVHPVADYRDPGVEYRSPPRTKPDLPPLTEEQRQAAIALLAAEAKDGAL